MCFSIFTICTNTTNPEYFHHPQNKPYIHWQSLAIVSYSQPLTITTLLFVSVDLPILTFYASRIIQYAGFYDWVLLLGIVFSMSIHVTWCISTSFLFLLLKNNPLYGYTTSCLATHQLRDIWIVSFQALWIMLLFIYKFLYGNVLISLELIPKNGIVGPW